MGNSTALLANDGRPATDVTSSFVMESAEASHCLTSDTDSSTHFAVQESPKFIFSTQHSR